MRFGVWSRRENLRTIQFNKSNVLTSPVGNYKLGRSELSLHFHNIFQLRLGRCSFGLGFKRDQRPWKWKWKYVSGCNEVKDEIILVIKV